MQKTSNRFAEMQQTVDQLVLSLAQSETRHTRAMRRQRWSWLGIVAFSVAVLYLTGQFGSSAFAQANQQALIAAGSGSDQALVAKREALRAMLPAEAQEALLRFEQQVEWVSQYMQTWDERQAGAVVALMLHRIGENMNSMPQIHQEMQTMNTLMQGMPIVATEMQRMSANMSVMTANIGVMTHNMDSTMGRMGRSLPWP